MLISLNQTLKQKWIFSAKNKAPTVLKSIAEILPQCNVYKAGSKLKHHLLVKVMDQIHGSHTLVFDLFCITSFIYDELLDVMRGAEHKKY